MQPEISPAAVFRLMKKFLPFVVVLLILFSCDFSLYKVNDGSYFPESVDEDLSGKISGYEAVKLSEIQLEGEEKYDISSSSDVALAQLIVNDLQEFINGGYFEQVISELGLSAEEIFDPSHLKPRSLQALLEIHARNEGIYIKDGYSYLYDVNLEYFDLVASIGFADALKFFLFYSTDNYTFAGSSIKADGSCDISFGCYAEGNDVPKAAAKGLISVNAQQLQFSELEMSISGRKILLYIPTKGGLKFSGHLSLGKSNLVYRETVNNDVAGFPNLKEAESIQKTGYHPYRIWLEIKETDMFDCSKLFREIKAIASAGSSLITESSYQKIRSILWPESTGSEIVLGIDFDDGRSIVMKDWELLQFLFAN